MAKLKDINEYKGLYKIDTMGNVYSSKIGKRKDKITKGYRAIVLTKNKKQKNHLVHRLVAQTFIKNIHNKPDVNHKNANKLDNNINNLEWVTKKENSQHAVKLGLIGNWNSNKNGKLSGENNGRCKISDNELLGIRKGFTGKYGEISKLAKEYGVRRETMSQLLNNKYRSNIISQ